MTRRFNFPLPSSSSRSNSASSSVTPRTAAISRAAVFERFAEGLRVETGLSRDVGLDLDAVDGSGVEAPRFAKGPQVLPIGAGSLEGRRLRRDARRPRGVEIVHALNHPFRIHWH